MAELAITSRAADPPPLRLAKKTAPGAGFVSFSDVIFAARRRYANHEPPAGDQVEERIYVVDETRSYRFPA